MRVEKQVEHLKDRVAPCRTGVKFEGPIYLVCQLLTFAGLGDRSQRDSYPNHFLFDQYSTLIKARMQAITVHVILLLFEVHGYQ